MLNNDISFYICKMMAFMAIILGLGLLFYILLGLGNAET